MSNLRSNTRWLVIAQASKLVLQVASVTVLARLLSPEHYGIMAMTLPVVNFAGIFRDFGISAAIIQLPMLDARKWNAAFWCSSILGLMVGVLICAVAYPASVFFRQEELFWVLLAVSVTFPLAGLIAPHQALLERNGGFKKLTQIELGGQFIALCIAIGCAYAGMGVLALVLQTISASLIVAVCNLVIASWRPKLEFDKSSMREVLTFSKGLLGFNVVNYFSRNSDTYIIGRMLGASALGVYNIAYRLMLFPLQSVTLVANRALYPELSRQQNAIDEMRKLYFGGIEFIALITFPAMVILWCLRDPFVQVVFGEKWHGLADLIYWLAPVGLLQSVTSTTGPVLMAKGRTTQLFRLGIIGAVFQVSGIVAGAFYGLNAVAIGYLVGNLAYMLFQFKAVDSVLSTGVSEFVRAIGPATIGIVFLIIATEFALYMIKPHFGGFLLLALGGLSGGAAYVASLLLIFPDKIRKLIRSPQKR